MSGVRNNVELSTRKLGSCYVLLTPLTPTQYATATKNFMGTNSSKKIPNRLTNTKATSAYELSNVYLKQTFGIRRLKIRLSKIQTKQG